MSRLLTDIEFQDRLRKNNPAVYTDDVYCGSKQYMNFYCDKGHNWSALAGNVLARHGCPYCSGRCVIVGETDLRTMRPDIARLLKYADDGIKYTAQSNKDAVFVCPECKTEQLKKINNVCNQGFSCKYCADGISYPNKFLRSLLSQLNVRADYEWQPQWLNPYFYDSYFVVDDRQYVIEMDGRLGHGNYTIHNCVDTAGLIIDEKKDALARENNITIIRVDCAYGHEDRFEYIKRSIMRSDVRFLFDLSAVDWDLCNKFGLTSNVMTAANMYMNGSAVGEISSTLNYDRHTIVRWLKAATRIGQCDYDQYESRRRSKAKDVGYQVNQYDINGVLIASFASVRDAERKTHLSHTSIRNALDSASHMYAGYLWFFDNDKVHL